MQLIMMFRIFALYQQSHKVLIFVLISFVSEVAATSALLVFSFKQLNSLVPSSLVMIQICAPHTVPKLFYTLWIPIILFETLLFVLSFIAGLTHIRRMHGVKRLQRQDLFSILLRDSVAYFLIILVAYFANAVAWLALPKSWSPLPDGLSLASTCIMGCRLVLNLRQAFYLPFARDSDSDHHVLSDFRTAEPGVWDSQTKVQGDAGIELGPVCTFGGNDPGVIYLTHRGPFFEGAIVGTPKETLHHAETG